MKLLNLAAVLTAAAVLSVPPIAVKAAETAKAMLKDANGQEAGSVSFTQTPAGVLLQLSLKGVPTGEHAFHIHAVGKCEPPKFESAGGHFNPANAHHGMMSGPGHAGDMPNLHVPASGALDLEVLNTSITLDKDKANSVFHPGGTAIVIHAGKLHERSGRKGRRPHHLRCDRRMKPRVLRLFGPAPTFGQASAQTCSKTTRPARRRACASSLPLERMDDGRPCLGAP